MIKTTTLLLFSLLFITTCDEPTKPDTTAPTVVITSPVEDATLSSATTIRVDATDDTGVEKVEFLIDGQVIAIDTEEPWEHLWQVSYYADGETHSILAKAYDEAENIGQSDLVHVFVSEDAQETPQLISPANGVFTNTNVVNLTWSSIAGAEEYIVLVSSNSEFPDTEYSITTSDTTVTTDALIVGQHYWKVRAKNSVGNYGEWSNYFTFEITGPESPTLLSPDNGEVIDAEIAELVWSTSEFTVAYDVIVSSSYNFTDTEYSITTSDTTVTTDALSDGMHYWKVRAKNSVGNYGEWSDVSSFIFINWIIGEMTDQDGNTYQTIQIGTQEWMMENLKVTHYRDGTAIPTGHSNSDWSNLTTGAYAVYDNNESNADTYGYLYNWYAVDDSRNIAPEGWHVPTDAEWTILTDYLGGESVAGGKMKEAGTSHWNSPNTDATNESGFTALPGGYRYTNIGSYDDMGNYGYFWSSTEYSSADAWYRILGYSGSDVARNNGYKRNGFSVRCIRD